MRAVSGCAPWCARGYTSYDGYGTYRKTKSQNGPSLPPSGQRPGRPSSRVQPSSAARPTSDVVVRGSSYLKQSRNRPKTNSNPGIPEDSTCKPDGVYLVAR